VFKGEKVRVSVFELSVLVLLLALLVVECLTLFPASSKLSEISGKVSKLSDINESVTDINSTLNNEGISSMIRSMLRNVTRISGEVSRMREVEERMYSDLSMLLSEIRSNVTRVREYVRDINASVRRIELILKGIREILLSECTIRPEQAILALRMNECGGSTAHDSSNHNNNGLIHNASWVEGLTGCGLAFDGDGYVEVSDSESLHVRYNLTVMLWAKPAANTSGPLIAKGFNTTWLKYMFKIDPNDSRITWGICTASYDYQVNTTAPEPGRWHHYALVVEMGRNWRELRVFIDGELVGKKSGLSLEILNVHPNVSLKIGAFPRMKGFVGTVDEVYIYSKALEDGEIYRHYICGRLGHLLSRLDEK